MFCRGPCTEEFSRKKPNSFRSNLVKLCGDLLYCYVTTMYVASFIDNLKSPWMTSPGLTCHIRLDDY